MSRPLCFVVLLALFAAFLPGQSFANCKVDNSVSQASPIYTDDTSAGGMNGTICGRTVIIYPGGPGGCEVIQRNNATGSSGTCLTLGRGVKFSGSTYYKFDCPSGTCGTAIAVSQSASSGVSEINNTRIEGDWTAGIVNSFYTLSSQANFIKMIGGPSTTVGIDGFKTVTESRVSGLDAGAGVYLRGGATLSSSSIFENHIAVHISDENTISNTNLADNEINIYKETSIWSEADLKGVAVRHGSTCDCYRATGGCGYDISICASFSGTNVSFIGNDIWE